MKWDLIRNRKIIPYIVVAVLGALWLISPVEISETVHAPVEKNSEFLFGDTRTVGQSFTPIVGLRAIALPIQVPPNAEDPLLLHIRESYFGEDIRTAALFDFSGQNALFQFDPISYPEKQLIWILEAPNSPDKTYGIFREIDTTGYPVGTAFTKGQALAGDFGFTQKGSISVARSLKRSIDVSSREVSIFITEHRSQLPVILVSAAVFLWLWRYFSLPRILQNPRYMLPLVLVLSLATHIWYASVLPLNNDEGAYLQDALQTSSDMLPIRDFLTKGPVYIFLLKIWTAVSSMNVVSLRMLSAIFWTLGSFLLYAMARRFTFTSSQALIAALIFGVSPGVVALTTPLLLQVVSSVISIAALLVLIEGTKKENSRNITIAALLMIVAYLTRASSAITAIVGLFIILFFGTKSRWKMAGQYIGIGVTATMLLLSASYIFLGLEKTAVLFNFEAALIAGSRAAEVLVAESILRQIIEAARVLWYSAPWLIGGFLASPILLMPYVPKRLRLIVATLLLLGLFPIFQNWQDMSFLFPRHMSPVIAVAAFVVFGMPTAACLRAMLRTYKDESFIRPEIAKVIVLCFVWLALLWMLYSSWGKFVESYSIEFIAPLSLLCAVSLGALFTYFNSRIFKTTFGILLTASVTFGWMLINNFPHTGTIDIQSLQNISAAVQNIVPVGEEIFTAQAAVTAFSERPIMLGYSHSGWYLYEQRGEVSTELRRIYFREPQEVTQYFKEHINYVLMDRRTEEVYFSDYPERVQVLERDFELVEQVANPAQDDFYLFKRKTRN